MLVRLYSEDDDQSEDFDLDWDDVHEPPEWVVRLGAIVVMLLAIGLGALPWLFLMGPLSELGFQKNFPKVQGEVVSFKAECGPCADDRWNLNVQFAYEVEGSSYVGRQKWYVGTIRPNAPAQGTPIEVHYNPSEPGEAFLKPGRVSSETVGIVILGFMVSFLVVLGLFFSYFGNS